MPDPPLTDSPESLVPRPSPATGGLSPADSEQQRGLRPSTPLCPRCDCNLQGAKHSTGIAWRCQSCGGQSLNFSQFRRMVPGAHVDEIWVTTTSQPVAAPRLTRCPECRRHMTAVLVPAGDREIELDVCRRCQRLWLENQEKISETLDSGGPPGKKSPFPHPAQTRPPLLRLTKHQTDDQAHQDFQERMLRARMFTERERGPKPLQPMVIALIGLLLLLWLAVKRPWL